MVRKKSNPLDWTENQVDNFLTFLGAGIVLYWVARGLTPDLSFLGFFGAIFFGKRLIRVTGRKDENANSPIETVRKLVKTTQSSNQREPNNNVDSSRRSLLRRRVRVLSLH